MPTNGYYKIENKGIKLTPGGEMQTANNIDGKYLYNDTEYTIQESYVFRKPIDIIHFEFSYMGEDSDYPDWDITNALGPTRTRLLVVMGGTTDINADLLAVRYYRQNNALYIPGVQGDDPSRPSWNSYYGYGYTGRAESYWEMTKEKRYTAHLFIYNPYFPMHICANTNDIIGGPPAGVTLNERSKGRKSFLYCAMMGRDGNVFYQIIHQYINRFPRGPVAERIEGSLSNYKVLGIVNRTGINDFEWADYSNTEYGRYIEMVNTTRSGWGYTDIIAV